MLHRLGRFPWLMGIVNVTPDSFSDGGDTLDPAEAIDRGRALVEQGADIIDIGGESTRPEADPVSADEELRRVMPVVAGLAECLDVPLSIDTTKGVVAREALAAGASVVNDVSGLELDETMIDVCLEADAAIVCMHRQGTPRSMQLDPRYGDVVAEVAEYLERRIEILAAAGVDRERIVLDPGIGFGKTATHNLELLSSIARLRAAGRPVLVGHSRKRFLSKLLGGVVEERSAGTIGVAVALAAQGTDIIRVHDVGAVRDALLAWAAVDGGNPDH